MFDPEKLRFGTVLKDIKGDYNGLHVMFIRPSARVSTVPNSVIAVVLYLEKLLDEDPYNEDWFLSQKGWEIVYG